MRIFLDTNVLASALATRGLCAELFEVVLQSHTLLVSEPVLAELARVLPDKLGQTRAITDDFISLLRAQAEMAAPSEAKLNVADPDDVAIVASALAGQADLFVTGDKALLKLQRIEGLAIASPRGLWEALAR